MDKEKKRRIREKTNIRKKTNTTSKSSPAPFSSGAGYENLNRFYRGSNWVLNRGVSERPQVRQTALWPPRLGVAERTQRLNMYLTLYGLVVPRSPKDPRVSPKTP